jgi:hypothetical protein
MNRPSLNKFKNIQMAAWCYIARIPYQDKGALLSSLTEQEANLVLENLDFIERVNNNIDFALAAIAKNHPEKVLSFVNKKSSNSSFKDFSLYDMQETYRRFDTQDRIAMVFKYCYEIFCNEMKNFEDARRVNSDYWPSINMLHAFFSQSFDQRFTAQASKEKNNTVLNVLNEFLERYNNGDKIAIEFVIAILKRSQIIEELDPVYINIFTESYLAEIFDKTISSLTNKSVFPSHVEYFEKIRSRVVGWIELPTVNPLAKKLLIEKSKELDERIKFVKQQADDDIARRKIQYGD